MRCVCWRCDGCICLAHFAKTRTGSARGGPAIVTKVGLTCYQGAKAAVGSKCSCGKILTYLGLSAALCRPWPERLFATHVTTRSGRTLQPVSLGVVGHPVTNGVHREGHFFVDTIRVILVIHKVVTKRIQRMLYNNRMKEIPSGATRKSKKGMAGRTAALKIRIGNMFWYLPSPKDPDNGLNPAILSGSLLNSASQRGITQASFVSALA